VQKVLPGGEVKVQPLPASELARSKEDSGVGSTAKQVSQKGGEERKGTKQKQSQKKAQKKSSAWVLEEERREGNGM
jgi:hypothetical protein